MKIKFKTSVEKIEISGGSPSFTTSVANFVLYFYLYSCEHFHLSASDPFGLMPHSIFVQHCLFLFVALVIIMLFEF